MLNMTADEKRRVAEVLTSAVDAGETYESFVNTVARHLGRSAFDVAHALQSTWDHWVAQKKHRDEARALAQSKEVRAVALYDALVALGWTPPHA